MTQSEGSRPAREPSPNDPLALTPYSPMRSADGRFNMIKAQRVAAAMRRFPKRQTQPPPEPPDDSKLDGRGGVA